MNSNSETTTKDWPQGPSIAKDMELINLQSTDPFTVFAAQNYLAKNLALFDATKMRTWLKEAVDHVYTNRTESRVPYLELFHRLLKTLRKQCQKKKLPITALDPGYSLLSIIAENQCAATERWIQRGLESQHQATPLLVFLIDIVKLFSVFESKETDCMKHCFYCCERILQCIKVQWSGIVLLWRSDSITVARKSIELIRRLVEVEKESMTLCDGRIDLTDSLFSRADTALEDLFTYWDELCQNGFSYANLLELQEIERTEFFYTPIGSKHLTVDRECLKQCISMAFTALSLAVYRIHCSPHVDRLHDTLLNLLLRLHDYSPQRMDNQVLDILFDFYGNNDEDAVRQQRCILHFYISLDQKERLYMNRIESEHQQRILGLLRECFELLDINPHNLFLYFLYKTGMSHEILVDLLMSDETEFLEFFVEYLRYIEGRPNEFIRACKDMSSDSEEEEEEVVSGIEAVSTIFRDLVTIITLETFPYNATVLVRRLQTIIALLECE
ncbi:hypothetical protein BDF14DRAFT_635544 [Spinellus fusiger]|nr:hypothetical protein BDF14DRAFT_635544 [Spinellus fusiger]